MEGLRGCLEHSTPGTQGDISFLGCHSQDQECNRLLKSFTYSLLQINKKGMLWMKRCFRLTVIMLFAHSQKVLLPFKVPTRSSRVILRCSDTFPVLIPKIITFHGLCTCDGAAHPSGTNSYAQQCP